MTLSDLCKLVDKRLVNGDKSKPPMEQLLILRSIELQPQEREHYIRHLLHELSKHRS